MLWPKQTREQVEQYQRRNPKKVMLASARARAKAKGLDFDITEDDFEIPENCPYLKVPMKARTRYAPSLDRINSNEGYVKGNIEVISRKANIMKNDASTEELLEFAYTILERN